MIRGEHKKNGMQCTSIPNLAPLRLIKLNFDDCSLKNLGWMNACYFCGKLCDI